MKTYTDIEFTRHATGPVLLDVHVPDGHEPARDNLPVIVWVHGGGWRQGNKEGFRGAELVERGVALVSVGYRLTPVAPWPAQLHDCKAGVRWVHAHAGQFGFDRMRVGVWGSSAGGHLAAMLAVTNGDPSTEGDGGWNDFSSTIHACVNWCGPTDHRRLTEPTWQVVRQSVIVEVTEMLLGGPVVEKADAARHASPAAHVKPGLVPIMTMHGLMDDVVSPEHARTFHEALIRCGNPSELHLLDGAGHGFGTPEREEVVWDFFKRTLPI